MTITLLLAITILLSLIFLIQLSLWVERSTLYGNILFKVKSKLRRRRDA